MATDFSNNNPVNNNNLEGQVKPALTNTSNQPDNSGQNQSRNKASSPKKGEPGLPLDPSTRQPLPPKATPGYYPGFSTLDQQNFWDETTRTLVLNRVNKVPEIRFFTEPADLALITAVFERIIPQEDRDQAHKIPLVPQLDERLYLNRINGYQYEDMPTDRQTYRIGLKAIEAIARHLHQRPFVDLNSTEQDEVLKTIHDGQPPAGQEYWQKLNVTHFWQMIVQDAIEGYYAHPFAWDEIGFGGPAYPRGYMRQTWGEPEPWEVQEKRYEWDTPPDALSGDYTPIGGQGRDQSHVGQEGTN
jgi:hypothetical protein